VLQVKEHRSGPKSWYHSAMRRRLDLELVRRGLTDSRARAQEAIEAGLVLVSGTRADRAGRLVSPDEPVHLEAPPTRYVSRGGEKLAAALDRFALDVAGRRALDAGASTGGFTDCLLQRGVASVLAVDVGIGQLAWSVRNDPRVTVRERCNARHLTPGDVGEPVDLVVADLSFISLRLVAPALAGVARDGADAVLLIKPQFEAGREQVRRGGLVTDPAVHRTVLEDVTRALASSAAMTAVAVMPSPLRGASGNIEFLGHFRVRSADAVPVEPAALAAAVEEGHR
jgi:23S rRNA (cytidine1920-2'-O)/16S rRNA (cytidine1409-2'-O)-methyltransferase